MAEQVMVVEDDRELRELLVDLLGEAGYESVPMPGADAALQAIEAGLPCDLVLTDLLMPGIRGEVLLERLRDLRPELNVIVMTAFGSIGSAIELVKAGAYDYLTKPLDSDVLLGTTRRALEESRLRREAAQATRAAGAEPPAGFVGASKPMQRLFQLVARVGAARQPVLITGESGTGKELVARALHARSGRGAFVAVNCGAIPENLLESELFGHERGAFTGADRAKEGLIEAADGGSLFLDEIGELPLALQPKLLHALEHADVRRVGATQPRAVDVRFILATNRDLEAEVESGRFREDLFWRLNVIHLHVPPLRERPADIPLLAEHFLEAARREAAGAGVPEAIAAPAMALLTAYPWPGNVRELRNAIHSAAAMSSARELRAEDLPPRIRSGGEAASLVAGASQQQLSLHELERLYVLEILRQSGGNKSRAADTLGLDRKTLYRKLQEYRLASPGLPGSGEGTA